MNCPLLAEREGRSPKSDAEEDEPVRSRGIWPVPLGEVTNQDARELLAEHDRLVWFVMGRYFNGYLRHRPAPGADAPLTKDDLHLVGQTALLRAWITWEPARGSWTTHATTCIKRAIGRTLGLERNVPEGRFITTDPFALEDPQHGGDAADMGRSSAPRGLCEAVFALADDGDPLERLEHENRMRWLHAQLEDTTLLTPRQRAVVEAMLVCATRIEAAELLGDLTRQGIEVQLKAALTKLRERAQMQCAWERAQSTIGL